MNKNILKIYRKIVSQWIWRPNVTGVSIGLKEVNGKLTDQISIKLHVAKKIKDLPLAKSFPKRIKGIPTDVVQGKYRIMILRKCKKCKEKEEEEENPRTKIFRPAPPGVSVGHKDVTAGTLGAYIWYITGKRVLALSNNHVFANVNMGSPGDEIYQPGPYDIENNNLDWKKALIGELDHYMPINFGGSECPNARIMSGIYNSLASMFNRKTRIYPLVVNRTDVATAKWFKDSDIKLEILNIGCPKGVFSDFENILGLRVKKTGRTTGYTEGIVSDYPFSTLVSYYNKTAFFIDQIRWRGENPEDIVIQGGDSGSTLWSKDKNLLVGLNFAGDNSGISGIANRGDYALYDVDGKLICCTDEETLFTIPLEEIL